MAALTDYAEHALLDHLVNRVVYPLPANVWVGFGKSVSIPDDTGAGFTEPVGLGYARISTSGANWSVATNFISNLSVLTTPTATGNWGTLQYVGLFDAASAGNLICYGNLGASQAVDNGGVNPDSAQFPVGSLIFRFPAAGAYLTDTYKKLWLEHMLGKVNWTPADLYLGLHVSPTAPNDTGIGTILEPAGAPTGNYVRQLLAGGDWSAAANSHIRYGAAVQFPTVQTIGWGEPTYFFLSTAVTGGTVAWYAPMSFTGATTIAVNSQLNFAASTIALGFVD